VAAGGRRWPDDDGRREVGDEVVAMSGVSVVRSGFRLLDGVDWVVRADERWVVVGPNGAGKTTLLRVAASHLHPTAGAVRLLGRTLGRVDVAELRERIGLASLAVADTLPPGDTVLDVVLTAAYGRLGRWTEQYDEPDLARARGLLAGLGVADRADRPFASLSEGERKRVLVARSLMADPELLLLDEPAAGMDLGAREDVVRRLGLLARHPAAPATVLVTHHLEEIPEGFTHALLLRAGRVVASGPLTSTLTSQALGETFGLPLAVAGDGGRWTARGR
jgi:iron complex transport system ATP-binding protein